MNNLDYMIECNLTVAPDTLDKRYTSHSKCELFLLLEGDVDIIINSRRYHLQPGALVLLSTRDLHLTINNTDQSFRRLTLHFDPKIMQVFSTAKTNLVACFNEASLKQRNIIYLSEGQIAEYQSYTRHIMPYWGSSAYGDDLIAIASLITLLVLVNRLYSTQVSQGPLPMMPLVEELVNYVDAHLSETLNIHSISTQFSYSEAYISTTFSQHMGMSLKHFISIKKMALAKQLLQQGDTVTQVCERCGFGDYSNFIRSFKKMEGISPNQWKKHQVRPVRQGLLFSEKV